MALKQKSKHQNVPAAVVLHMAVVSHSVKTQIGKALGNEKWKSGCVLVCEGGGEDMCVFLLRKEKLLITSYLPAVLLGTLNMKYFKEFFL